MSESGVMSSLHGFFYRRGNVRKESRPVCCAPETWTRNRSRTLSLELKSQAVARQTEWPKEPSGFLLNVLYAEVSSRPYTKPSLFSLLAPFFLIMQIQTESNELLTHQIRYNYRDSLC